jgi:hypothetical protein
MLDNSIFLGTFLPLLDKSQPSNRQSNHKNLKLSVFLSKSFSNDVQGRLEKSDT